MQSLSLPSLAVRPAARAGSRRAAVTVASAASPESRTAAVAGALSLLMVAGPALAVAASPEAIAAAQAEGATRLKACTTDECRQVINALNAKKLAKLSGVTAPKAAPSVRAAKTAPPPKAAPAPAPKPAAAVAKPAAKPAAPKPVAKKPVAKKVEKKSGGTNPLFYTISFFGKVAFAAGALAAPFIFLKKEEVILDDNGAIDTEKALSTLKGAATGVVDSLPNKDTVLLYGIGSLVALAVTDGIINLPLLNVIIGAPIQILGFITALALGKRYLVDGGDSGADAKGLAVKLNSLVPESLPKPLAPETEAAWSKKW